MAQKMRLFGIWAVKLLCFVGVMIFSNVMNFSSNEPKEWVLALIVIVLMYIFSWANKRTGS